MNGPTLTAVTLLATIILIPLVPAYVLYKLLPGETIVAGPLKGLKVRFTEAFGGYLALVVLSSAILAGYMKTESDRLRNEVELRERSRWDLWTINGTIVAPSEDQTKLSEEGMLVVFVPNIEPQLVGENKINFSVAVPLRININPDASDIKRVESPFRAIVIKHNGYFTNNIRLKGEVPNTWRVEESEKEIAIGSTINLSLKRNTATRSEEDQPR